MFKFCRALIALLIGTIGLSFWGYTHTHLYIDTTQQIAYMHLHEMNCMNEADFVKMGKMRRPD